MSLWAVTRVHLYNRGRRQMLANDVHARGHMGVMRPVLQFGTLGERSPTVALRALARCARHQALDEVPVNRNC